MMIPCRFSLMVSFKFTNDEDAKLVQLELKDELPFTPVNGMGFWGLAEGMPDYCDPSEHTARSVDWNHTARRLEIWLETDTYSPYWFEETEREEGIKPIDEARNILGHYRNWTITEDRDEILPKRKRGRKKR